MKMNEEWPVRLSDTDRLGGYFVVDKPFRPSAHHFVIPAEFPDGIGQVVMGIDWRWMCLRVDSEKTLDILDRCSAFRRPNSRSREQEGS